MKKTIQYFSDDYLKRCKDATPDEILEFLENFRILVSQSQEKCQLISLKIEPSLLIAFKRKATLSGIPYQRKIKQLMKDWILSN